jgi:alanine racemase
LDGRVPGIRRRALIDLDAFAANLARRADDWPLDVRSDAYGHGLGLVAPIVRAAGVSRVVVSDEAAAATMRGVGYAAGEIEVGWFSSDLTTDEYGTHEGGRPVMSLVGEVIAVKHVAAGAGVSYGYTHRTQSPTTLALIGLGYADGVPRLASNEAPVLVGGAVHRIAGRVAMDQLVVDCRDDVPELGSSAVLFGDPARGEPSAAEWSRLTRRTELDLVAGVGFRVERLAR